MSEANSMVAIPAKCLAGVVVEHGKDCKVGLEAVDVPDPGHRLLTLMDDCPDELLIKINVTGICCTDLHFMMEDLAIPTMGMAGCRSPGHEGAGVVVKVGANVRGWDVGDRAGIKPLKSVCHNCEYCWNMAETVCPRAEHTGLMSPGTYQEYLTSPAIYTSRIPDGVDDYVAAPIMCAGSTMYQAISELGLKHGDTVVIIGAGGGVGHMGVQIAKAMGLVTIGIDVGDSKRELCISLGCDGYIDVTKSTDTVFDVIQATGGTGAHGVIVTSGNEAAYDSAPKMLRVGGIVMCVGMCTAKVGADPLDYTLRKITIKGSFCGSMLSTERCLQMARRGLIKPVYELFPIKQLPEAVQKLKSGQVIGRCVVDFNT